MRIEGSADVQVLPQAQGRAQVRGVLLGEPDLALARGHGEGLDRRIGCAVRGLRGVTGMLCGKLTTRQRGTSCAAGAP
ncbi:hypothetical protein [Streptomyces olindensis]|uniref:hypothetical protein n=1 Tax=Streptomyces olindensis TaxID=358823 RepID=UPI0033CC35DF